MCQNSKVLKISDKYSGHHVRSRTNCPQMDTVHTWEYAKEEGRRFC